MGEQCSLPSPLRMRSSEVRTGKHLGIAESYNGPRKIWSVLLDLNQGYARFQTECHYQTRRKTDYSSSSLTKDVVNLGPLKPVVPFAFASSS